MFLATFLAYSCSGNDDNPQNLFDEEDTIMGEWKLAYLVDNGRPIWPEDVCNNPENNVLNLSFSESNQIEGNSICNQFVGSLEYITDEYFKLNEYLGVTEIECSSENQDCQFDGTYFEEVHFKLLENINNLETQEVHYRINGVPNAGSEVDSLVISADRNNRLYYWREAVNP